MTADSIDKHIALRFTALLLESKALYESEQYEECRRSLLKAFDLENTFYYVLSLMILLALTVNGTWRINNSCKEAEALLQAIHIFYAPGEDSAVDTLLLTSRQDLDTIYEYLIRGFIHKADDIERGARWQRTHGAMWQRIWGTTYISAMNSVNRLPMVCDACFRM